MFYRQCVFVVSTIAIVGGSYADRDPIQFNRDIRPILADNCWSCHGPDQQERQADLRLDRRAGAISSVIIPGNPKDSRVVQRILSDDPSMVMPPAAHRKHLTTEQKDLLVQWIAEGARWQDHWAWQPPVRSEGARRGAIDRFIEERLGKHLRHVVSRASEARLVRRLNLDILGVPPTPQRVDRYLASSDPMKYQRLVDELLSSPGYGERMAVMWLDLVRYADTNGYHADIPWSVWPYRDYVIAAFNSNMPFDQFTIEQIAGDLLPDATIQQRVAAGYNRLNMKSTESGIQDKEYLAKYAADRVRTTAGTWLGVTLGCAECHDHKFDPFSTRDFYRFAAFFADIKGVGYYPDAQRIGWGETISVPADGVAEEIEELQKQLRSEKARVAEAVLLGDGRAAETVWRYKTEQPLGAWQTDGFDDSHWRTGKSGFGSPGTPNTTIRTHWRSPDIWLRTHFSVSEVPEALQLSIQHDEDAVVFINGEKVTEVNGYSTGSPGYVQKEISADVVRAGENTIAVHCHQTGGGQYIDVGISASSINISKIETSLTTLRQSIPTMLATVSTKPREVRVLPRGNWMDDSGEVVLPGVPSMFNDQAMKSRLELARWITSPDNPLTARVMVNRLWHQFFGQGLSRSLDDIGSQGQWPTHPELLDWLALEFVQSGWDVKHIVRLIVTSQTYQRSSHPTEYLLEHDPENRLLARQRRFRVDAEFIRDSALMASGLIDRRLGGPSVMPYQPPGYWDNLNFPRRKYQHDIGSAQYRRGVYVHWQRQFLHPALLAFDAPSREECIARRSRSNTPLAALVMLNDPTRVESARALADRGYNEQQDDRARLDQMFRCVLTRQPSEEELSVLTQLLHKQRLRYSADSSAAESLLSVGQYKFRANVDSAEMAAWTSVARVLLNVHEFIVRY